MMNESRRKPAARPSGDAAETATRLGCPARAGLLEIMAMIVCANPLTRFNEDSHRISSEQFWNAAKERLQGPAKVDGKKVFPNEGAIRGVEMYRKVVLNAGAHAPPFTVTAPEIDGAIRAVDALKLEDKPLFERATELVAAVPPDFDPIMACCYLRGAFEQSLRKLCIRKRVHLPLLEEAASHTARAMWNAAKAHTGCLSGDATLIADIESNSVHFLDDLAHVNISAVSRAHAATLLTALEGARATPLSTRLDRLP